MNRAESVPSLPDDLREALSKAARHLGNGLQELDWPGGNRDSPCHEINALLSFYYFLSNQEAPFALYAEGTISRRGRVDLMGFNKDTRVAIAVEAKSFGKINRKSGEVLNDLERLDGFEPTLAEVANDEEVRRWWRDAHQRWAIMLITSFRGTRVADAWRSKEPEEVVENMSTYGRAERAISDADGSPNNFLNLWGKFASHNRDAALICDGSRWKECGEGWLLWGALPLLMPQTKGN